MPIDYPPDVKNTNDFNDWLRKYVESQRTQYEGSIVFPEDYGAKGDAITDDSGAIQAAIDECASNKKGIVQFMDKTYLCNIELKSYVVLRGASTGVGYASELNNRTILKAAGTGYIIDTPVAASYQMGVEYLCLTGLGSGTQVRGINLRNVSWSNFRYLSGWNFSDEYVYIADGVANDFERITVHNCLMDTSQAAHMGVMHLGPSSHDNYVSKCEIGASLAALTDANMYINAIVVEGSANMFSQVVAEASDIGFYLENSLAGMARTNKFVACRADWNWGHGWWIGNYNRYNMFAGCSAERNSRETTNTYDGFHLATARGNVFAGCTAWSLPSEGFVHRYGFYDDRANSDQTLRNTYTGCRSEDHGTAWFYGDTSSQYGSGPYFPDRSWTAATDEDATPSVDQIECLLLNYTANTTITDFDNATPGQEIKILKTGGAGTVTIADGATIKTNTDANKDMVNDRIYKFKDCAGVWYEDE